MAHEADTAPKEIKLVIEYLGRSEITGQYRDVHLGQVLIYLQMWRTGQWRQTISKLALRLGMTARHIRENYLEGLVAEGIISTSRSSDAILWSWVGLPEEQVETLSAYVERKEKEEKRGDKRGKRNR